MNDLLAKVIDGLDFETFIKAKSEEDAKATMISLIKALGFNDVDVVFVEYNGMGARVRARAYIHRASDEYGWLDKEKKGAGGE